MLSMEKKKYWIAGLSVAAFSFVTLLVGLRIFVKMEMTAENLLNYVVFSVLTGIIAALFVYFRLTIALLLYMAGLVLGVVLMYKAFIYDLTGWGDLAGIVSLMFSTAIGLGAGLLVQLVAYLIKRRS